MTPFQLVLSQQTIPYDVVKALIEKGASPNTTVDGDNYLHLAILHGGKANILNAIALKINVNRCNNDQQTALQLYLNTTKQRHSDADADVVAALIQAGADRNTKNNQGDNFLHMAIAEKNLDKILRAIAMGIDVMATNDENETAVQHYRRLYGADNSDSLNLLRECSHVKNRVERKPVQLDYQWIANLPPSDKGEAILDLLVAEVKKADARKDIPVAWLAQHPRAKEMVIEQITRLPETRQRSLIESALNPETRLGEFFAVQRGWLKTHVTRGSLAVLTRMQLGLFSESPVAGDMPLVPPLYPTLYPKL